MLRQENPADFFRLQINISENVRELSSRPARLPAIDPARPLSPPEQALNEAITQSPHRYNLFLWDADSVDRTRSLILTANRRQVTGLTSEIVLDTLKTPQDLCLYVRLHPKPRDFVANHPEVSDAAGNFPAGRTLVLPGTIESAKLTTVQDWIEILKANPELWHHRAIGLTGNRTEAKFFFPALYRFLGKNFAPDMAILYRKYIYDTLAAIVKTYPPEPLIPAPISRPARKIKPKRFPFADRIITFGSHNERITGIVLSDLGLLTAFTPRNFHLRVNGARRHSIDFFLPGKVLLDYHPYNSYYDKTNGLNTLEEVAREKRLHITNPEFNGAAFYLISRPEQLFSVLTGPELSLPLSRTEFRQILAAARAKAEEFDR